MSVDQTNIIDLIGIEKSSGKLVLTINDHLQWNNNEHLFLLQEKTIAYLRFIESGEIFDSYSDAKNRDILINLICKYSPSSSDMTFLEKVTEIIEGAGMLFEHKVIMS